MSDINNNEHPEGDAFDLLKKSISNKNDENKNTFKKQTIVDPDNDTSIKQTSKTDSEKKIKFVPAICTCCGATLQVDPSNDAAICKYCNTPFIVEKAINMYSIDNSTKNSIDNANIHADKIEVHQKGTVEAIIDHIEKKNLEKRRQEEKEELEREARWEKERIEREKKLAEDKAKAVEFAKNNKKTLGIVAGILIVIILIYVLVNAISNRNKICVGYASSSITGMNIDSAKEIFSKAGFSNVEEIANPDLVLGLFAHEGDVEIVSIDGKDYFNASTKFDPNAKVSIVYHTYPTHNESQTEASTSKPVDDGLAHIYNPNLNIEFTCDYYFTNSTLLEESSNKFKYSYIGVDTKNHLLYTLVDNMDAAPDELYVCKPLSYTGDIWKTASVEETGMEYMYDEEKEELIEYAVDNGKRVCETKYSFNDYGRGNFDEALANARYHEPEKYTSNRGGETNTVENDKDSGATDNKTKEPENGIYTVDNCAELNALAHAEYVDPTKQAAFIQKYKNKEIEFDAIVLAVFPSEDSKYLCSYVLIPGESEDNIGGALFYIENAAAGEFHWDKATRPDSVFSGSKIRIRATVHSGSDQTYIYLRPTKTWGR